MIEGFYKQRGEDKESTEYYFVKKITVIDKEVDEVICEYDMVAIYDDFKSAKISCDIKESYDLYLDGNDKTFYDMKKIKRKEYELAIEKSEKIISKFFSETRIVMMEKIK